MAAGVVAGVDFGILNLPAGEPYEGYAALVDDTGFSQVEAPIAWSEITTDPHEYIGPDDGTVTDPLITATMPNSGTDDLSAAMVLVTSDALTDSITEPLDMRGIDGDLVAECADSRRFDYDDGYYTGIADLWTGCCGQDMGVLLISTVVDGVSLSTEVWMSTTADIDAATRVIETFSFTGEQASPADIHEAYRRLMDEPDALLHVTGFAERDVAFVLTFDGLEVRRQTEVYGSEN